MRRDLRTIFCVNKSQELKLLQCLLVLVLKKSMAQDAKTSRSIEKSLGAIFKDTIVQAGRVDQIGTLLPKHPMVISLFGFLSNEIWVVIIREVKQKGKHEEEMKKKAKEGRWKGM